MDQSIVRVLTQGSWVKPVALLEIKSHFEKTDKIWWGIILKNLKGKTSVDYRAIWEKIDSTEGVKFTSRELIHMLLTLEWGSELLEGDN